MCTTEKDKMDKDRHKHPLKNKRNLLSSKREREKEISGAWKTDRLTNINRIKIKSSIKGKVQLQCCRIELSVAFFPSLSRSKCRSKIAFQIERLIAIVKFIVQLTMYDLYIAIVLVACVHCPIIQN